jgi:YfiH family protein
MAFSADCPLILLADASGPAVALAHTSWRSTVRRIVPRLINRMAAEFGTQPGDLVAGIAPSAGPCCYEVGADVAEAVRQEFGDGFADRSLRPTRRGKWMCDLWRANVEQLSAAGVATDRISVAGVCTICGRKNLPSYRREGDAAGRFVAVIGRP